MGFVSWLYVRTRSDNIAHMGQNNQLRNSWEFATGFPTNKLIHESIFKNGKDPVTSNVLCENNNFSKSPMRSLDFGASSGNSARWHAGNPDSLTGIPLIRQSFHEILESRIVWECLDNFCLIINGNGTFIVNSLRLKWFYAHELLKEWSEAFFQKPYLPHNNKKILQWSFFLSATLGCYTQLQCKCELDPPVFCSLIKQNK